MDGTEILGHEDPEMVADRVQESVRVALRN